MTIQTIAATTVINADAMRAALSDLRDEGLYEDGRGFSSYDYHFGCEMANRRQFSTKQWAACQRLVHKYRKQLAGYGHDVDALKSAPAPEYVPPKPVSLTCHWMAQSEAAIKVQVINTETDRPVGTFWFPKSQCQNVSDFGALIGPDEFTLVIPAWLADRNGIAKYGTRVG